MSLESRQLAALILLICSAVWALPTGVQGASASACRENGPAAGDAVVVLRKDLRVVIRENSVETAVGTLVCLSGHRDSETSAVISCGMTDANEDTVLVAQLTNMKSPFSLVKDLAGGAVLVGIADTQNRDPSRLRIVRLKHDQMQNAEFIDFELVHRWKPFSPVIIPEPGGTALIGWSGFEYKTELGEWTQRQVFCHQLVGANLEVVTTPSCVSADHAGPFLSLTVSKRGISGATSDGTSCTKINISIPEMPLATAKWVQSLPETVTVGDVPQKCGA